MVNLKRAIGFHLVQVSQCRSACGGKLLEALFSELHPHGADRCHLMGVVLDRPPSGARSSLALVHHATDAQHAGKSLSEDQSIYAREINNRDHSMQLS